MEAALETFRNEIYSPDETVSISDSELRQFARNCEERRLYSFQIPGRCWLSVNDPKALAKLIELV